MAEDVALVKKELSVNPCCTEWKKQYLKLQEKYSKLELRRNALREGITMVNEKFDVVENENKMLKEALEGLKAQSNKEKDEREKESATRVSLENEVSTLKAELLILRENHNSVGPEADGAVLQLQERLATAETEINRLKELLDKERVRADSEKKKSDEALKKINAEKSNFTKAKKLADIERKKADESRLQFEKLKSEIDEAKSKLALEMSKTEEANKRVEAERQKAIQERKLADSAMAKAEQQRKLAEINSKKAMDERSHVDQLSKKLEEERRKVEKLEEDSTTRSLGGKGKPVLEATKAMGLLHEELEKKRLEREHTIIREKKRIESERTKAEKQRKIAEAHKKEAMSEKHRADQLSQELEGSKQRIEQLQKELHNRIDNSAPLANSSVISETATIRLLKKQLKFEKMLSKHAKQVAREELGQSNILRRQLFQLKKESLQFQQRLDILNDCFLQSSEGIDELEKINNLSFSRDHSGAKPNQVQFYGKNGLVTKASSMANTAVLGCDPMKRNLEYTTSSLPLYASGIDSELEPLCRVSNRKMLQSSALNSSSVSFSDRPFVGSQDRGDFSITTSAKLSDGISNLEPPVSRLAGEMRGYNQNIAAIAEDSVKSPIRGSNAERVSGHAKKRKRILEAVESIGNLYSNGQKLQKEISEKLSALHGILHGQKEEPAVGNQPGDSCRKRARRDKKRKSCEVAKAINHVHCSIEPQSTIENLEIQEFDVCNPASSPVYNLVKTYQDGKDRSGDSLTDNQSIPRDFEELANHDHMKLLSLDNDVDEKSYLAAISSPLSPALPEIEFQENGAFEEHNNSKVLVSGSFYNGLLKVKDKLTPNCSLDVLDVETNSSKLEHNSSYISQLEKDDRVVSSKDPAGSENGDLDFDHVSNACLHQIKNPCDKLGMTDKSNCGGKKSTSFSESKTAACNDGPKYCVVFVGTNDNNSICRTLRTISYYMSEYSLIYSTDSFLRSILLALSKAEDLSSKEKVCVLFSLLLHAIPETEMTNVLNEVSNESWTPLETISGHFSVLSDVALRRIFMESCNLFELLDLIKDFLLERKVLVCSCSSSEWMHECESKVKLMLNGKVKMLSIETASSHLLVAGGTLLASLCSAFDNIGFICETSCNMLMMEKLDASVVLTILHVFANLSGSKYLNHEQHSVEMTVVKSLVVLLEKHNCSTISTSSPSSVKLPSKIWSCSNCPFSEGAVPMDGVASLLLEKLQKYTGAGIWPEDPYTSFVPGLYSDKVEAEKMSHHGEAVLSSSISQEILCNFIDILSLFEPVASFMGWDWAFDNVVHQLWELLKVCAMGNLSMAIFILLGHLGRLGVNTSGYEDHRVEKLRGWLSSFLCSPSEKLSHSVQFAVAHALSYLIPVKFEELVENKETPANMSQSDAANCIRKWFFLLSSEQQSCFRLQHAVAMTKSQGKQVLM